MKNVVALRSDRRKDTHSRGPKPWQRLGEQYPAVVDAYERLRQVCNSAGPLDEPAVALVKLAVSIGSRSERTVHIHSKKALCAGVEADALRQVALVALPTIGLPAALDALKWVEESIEETLHA
jgi:alkylhydroperoxidase/carboxymuconolactone decarboxylase family protein YurZ